MSVKRGPRQTEKELFLTAERKQDIQKTEGDLKKDGFF